MIGRRETFLNILFIWEWPGVGVRKEPPDVGAEKFSRRAAKALNPWAIFPTQAVNFPTQFFFSFEDKVSV